MLDSPGSPASRCSGSHPPAPTRGAPAPPPVPGRDPVARALPCAPRPDRFAIGRAFGKDVGFVRRKGACAGEGTLEAQLRELLDLPPSYGWGDFLGLWRRRPDPNVIRPGLRIETGVAGRDDIDRAHRLPPLRAQRLNRRARKTLHPHEEGGRAGLLVIAFEAMREGTWRRLKACRNEDCHYALHAEPAPRAALEVAEILGDELVHDGSVPHAQAFGVQAAGDPDVRFLPGTELLAARPLPRPAEQHGPEQPHSDASRSPTPAPSPPSSTTAPFCGNSPRFPPETNCRTSRWGTARTHRPSRTAPSPALRRKKAARAKGTTAADGRQVARTMKAAKRGGGPPYGVCAPKRNQPNSKAAVQSRRGRKSKTSETPRTRATRAAARGPPPRKGSTPRSESATSSSPRVPADHASTGGRAARRPGRTPEPRGHAGHPREPDRGPDVRRHRRPQERLARQRAGRGFKVSGAGCCRGLHVGSLRRRRARGQSLPRTAHERKGLFVSAGPRCSPASAIAGLACDATTPPRGPETGLFLRVAVRLQYSGENPPFGASRRRRVSGLLTRDSLARPAGLEPATCGLEVRCSIQLSYGRRSRRWAESG